MNKKQNEVLQFLLKYNTAREEQIMQLTKCSKADLDYLLSNKLIEKNNNTNLYFHKLRGLDIKFSIALDIICKNEKNISNFYKGRFPVIIFFDVENTTFDVIVAKTIEQTRIFQELDKISFADKIIIIIENQEKFNITDINTDREVLICTYPLKIIAKVN